MKDGKAKHGQKQRWSSSLELGEGGPDNGAHGKPEDVEREAQSTDLTGDVELAGDGVNGGGVDTASKGRVEGGPG